MFGKLLKHDLRATGRIIPIILGTALLMAFLAFLPLLFNDSPGILRALLGTMLGFCLVIVPVLTYVFLVMHFYKSSYGANSYLTRTLPVSQRKVYYSKLLIALFWMLLAMLVSGIMLISLIALIGSGLEGIPAIEEELGSIGQQLSDFFPTSTKVLVAIFLPLYLLLTILQWVLLYQFCFCAGNLGPFRRMGVASSLLIYAIYYVAEQVLSTLSTLVPLQVGLNEQGYIVFSFHNYYQSLANQEMVVGMPALPLILAPLLCLAAFFLCRRWYAKSINLR